MIADFVARHPFSPLLHYTKSDKRYKKDAETGVRTITTKDRPIKYASHRDSCILSYYSKMLNAALESRYSSLGIDDNVIAYRSLGKGNYDFAAEVLSFAKKRAPVTILAFDVTSFFDTIDHKLLKQRLKSVLGVSSLSDDWHRVFKAITAYHYVDIADLKAHPTFGPRLAVRTRDRIAGVEELKSAGILFRPNPEVAMGRKRGIPQGTPISAAASNLFMLDFDAAAAALCAKKDALYRRYSDDILVVCDKADSVEFENEIVRLIELEGLEINASKTERSEFQVTTDGPRPVRTAQYLGFKLDNDGPSIRESSLSRQWRKLRRALKRIKKIASAKISAGLSEKAHRKSLLKRFSHLKVRDETGIRTIRNFSSYGRRSAAAFGDSEKITHQVKRFEKAAQREISALKALSKKLDP